MLFSGYKALLALPAEEKAVVMPVVERAYFWRHPEQLLLACLASPDAAVRGKAVERILQIRQAPNQRIEPSRPEKRGKAKRKSGSVRPITAPKSN